MAAEHAVVYVMLHGGDPYYAEYAAKRLRREDFGDDRYGKAFQALVDLWQQHGRVEPVALAGDLTQRATKERWCDIIASISAGYDYEPALIGKYVEQIAETSRFQRIKRITDRMAADPDNAAVIAAELQDDPVSPTASIMTANDLYPDTERVYREGQASGVTTGWPSLDQHFTVRKGQLTVITGIPNHGKSTWLDALLVQLSELHGWRHLVWTPEAWPYGENHMPHIIQRFARRPFDRGPTPRIPEEQLPDLAATVAEHFRWIDSSTVRTPEALVQAAELEIRRRPYDTLVIDPFTELARPAGARLHDFVYDVLTALDQFMQRHSVHVFVVAHPRKLEKGVGGAIEAPTVYDIAESSHWANRADVIVVVHRNDFYTVTIDVQKVRHRAVGVSGKVQLNWDPSTYRFQEKF